jgi:hypothetical protein
VARHVLQLTGVEAELVLYPGDGEELVEAVRVTVHGPTFPQRALVPELIVGKAEAERVSITPDGRTIRGYFRTLPPEGASVTVRYGNSLEGTLRKAFHRRSVRPLPKGC